MRGRIMVGRAHFVKSTDPSGSKKEGWFFCGATDVSAATVVSGSGSGVVGGGAAGWSAIIRSAVLGVSVRGGAAQRAAESVSASVDVMSSESTSDFIRLRI